MAVSPYAPTFQIHYPATDRRIQPYQQNQQQLFSSDSFATRPDVTPKDSSTIKSTIMMLLIGLSIGLILCGIPLAVMSALYMQQKSQTSSSGANSSSGSTGSVNLPSQCTSYTINIDSTRNVGYSCSGCYSDCSLTTGWYRFMGSAGTDMPTSPISTGYCGSSYPGWFNATLPTTAGATSTGTVCANMNGNLCYSLYSVTSIIVTNCNGFNVYYLRPMPYCNSRYCSA